MSDEMKLLMAMCEATGLKVSIKLDYEAELVKWSPAFPIKNYSNPYRRLATKPGSNEYDINSDGLYTSLLVEPVKSYKVEKVGES